MDSRDDSDDNITDAINILTSMFGNIVSREVIVTVAESCGENLDLAVDTLVTITNEYNSTDTSGNMEETGVNASAQAPVNSNPSPPNTSESTVNQSIDVETAVTPSTSYVSAAQTTPQATPQATRPPKSVPDRVVPIDTNFWTSQIRRIATCHNNGACIIIIMRGLPGSGKTHLARRIIDTFLEPNPKNYDRHIFSADDYFMVRGKYVYDKSKISAAHDWNNRRIYNALREGLSPIIVDNTNTELWEMNFAVFYGVKYGYYIEILEPNTSWKYNALALFKRNSHNVPLQTFKNKLERYIKNVSTETLLKFCKVDYQPNLIPPVLRRIPSIAKNKYIAIPEPPKKIKNQPNTNDDQQHVNQSKKKGKQEQSVSISTENTIQSTMVTSIVVPSKVTSDVVITGTSSKTDTICDRNTDNNNTLSKNKNEHNQIKDEVKSEENIEEEEAIGNEIDKRKLLDAEKCLEELQKVEQEWENGEGWDDGNQNDDAISSPTENTPKPPRLMSKQNSLEIKSDELMASVSACEDWSRISMYMAPWTNEPQNSESIDTPIPIEKTTSSTCVEIGDTDMLRNNYKQISAVSRNINSSFTIVKKEKIPDQRMFDKSTMTNEQLMIESLRCKNEEQHFIAFRKLFKNINRAELRDIFEKCCGDVNWAVDIVFDGMANKVFDDTEADDLSDDEEIVIEACDCLASYNIIPDSRKESSKTSTPEDNVEVPENRPLQQKRPKQEPLSESSLKLKREIEKNVKISEEHYSPRSLKIRQIRRGEVVTDDDPLAIPGTSGMSNSPSDQCDSPKDVESKSVENETTSQSDDDTNSEPSETYITVDLRKGLIHTLDELFGRKEMEYPENIVPVASMPMSLMNEINALWVESLTYQLDQQSDQASLMLKQDEEIARQFVSKEIEFKKEGKEPVVPDFKEIMDMDLAVSLYQKDVAKWKKKEPQDLAARMTRDKLYNLFPEISSEVLAELLMAHENNFQNTVEVLLISTGRTEILETENGINKFVMEKELERQKTIMEQERKALSEEEWPLLPLKDEVVEMETVQKYRDEANMHLEQRNYNHNKAQQCIRMGMLQVANHYIDAANLHKQKYEIAKNLAASSLIQIQATKHPDCATIDLHYLRVSEARESLDIFLDTHIRKLRESQSKGGPKQNTLFFITGRGNHSNGGPRIKPAMKKRLLERGLGYAERNPGMLMAKVCAENKLSYQLNCT